MATKQDEYNVSRDPQHKQFNKVGKRTRNNETDYTGAKNPPDTYKPIKK